MDRSLLHGHDPSERIVGLHPSSAGRMSLYRREGDTVVHADEPWFPFFFLNDASLLRGFPRRHWIKELEGPLVFSRLCAFEEWTDLWEAVRLILHRSNIATAAPEEHYADLDVLFLVPDPQSQYFLQTGRTLFRGMPFSDLRRLHIEARFEKETPKTHRLSSILLTDCLGWEVRIDRGSEREMLKRLVDTVRKRDPDLLQGPSFYRSLLPRLMELADSLGVPFTLGRDGSRPSQPVARFMDPASPRDAPLWEVAGRLILDLPRGENPRPGSGAAASLSAAVQFFELSQIAPPAHGNLRYPGMAKRFEHLLLREYVRVRHSIPALTPRGTPHGNGHLLYYSGLLGPVVEAGFAGLHAREMLAHQIFSRNDPLGALPAVLEALLEAAAEHAGNQEQSGGAYDTLLGTLLPYLQTGRTLFGDPDAAEALKEAVGSTVASLDARLTAEEAKLVSSDGERFLIVPPPGIASEDAERRFVQETAHHSLPGVVPALLGRYRRALCFRRHDLALLGYDGTCVIRISDLLSSDLEPFARTFLEGCTNALLTNDLAAMHRLYVEWHGAIRGRTWDIGDFARTEVITTPLQRYVRDVEEGKREKSAPHEVMLRTGRWLPAGARVAYYFTQAGAGEAEPPLTDVPAEGTPLPPGASAAYAVSRRWRGAEEWDDNFPDEDTDHYLERLEGLARRFAPFFEAEDHHVIFSSDELFPFDPARIVPVTVRVQDDRAGTPPPIRFGIWLDQ